MAIEHIVIVTMNVLHKLSNLLFTEYKPLLENMAKPNPGPGRILNSLGGRRLCSVLCFPVNGFLTRNVNDICDVFHFNFV